MKTLITALSLILIIGMGTTAFAKGSNKAKGSEAKRECLKENPDLKGKALKACVTKKRKAKK